MRTFVVVLLAAGLAACAGPSTQRTLQVPAGALHDRSIVVVREAPPALGAAGIEQDLVETYSLADPAARIGRGLAIGLATARGMIVLSTSGTVAAAADPQALAAAHPGADYVLEVTTVHWALDNYATARDRYRLDYAARLRLIDAEGAVVAAARCETELGDADYPASRDSLLAQDAALVKGYLDLATARCIEHAARNMLGLRDPETQVASTRGRPIRIPPPSEAVPLDARVPANAAMPSVHEFFDASVAPAPTPAAAPKPTSAPIVIATPQPVATPSPTPRPATQTAVAPQPSAAAVASAAPRERTTPAPRRADAERVAVAPAVPAATPKPTPAPTPAPTPVPVPAPAPVEAPPEDDLLRTDRLTPAARASGEVIELLEDTPFRDSPRLTTRISRTLPAGTEAVVRQRVFNAEGEWWFIIIPGDIGWIRSPDPIPYGSPRAGTDIR